MNTSHKDTEMCRSSFTLTFVIELIGIDVWHDCNDGWLDLGPSCQGFKLQYQLYPGYSWDIDVLVWPHCVKIWCGGRCGWARTWMYLQRRWTAFSIRHLLPVRVSEMLELVVTLTPSVGMGSLGAAAKNDKNAEVYLPKLEFGERRYFGKIKDSEEKTESLLSFIYGLIWNRVEKCIPVSYLDGDFDTPQPVTDVRHQDAVISAVQDIILNREISAEVLPSNEKTSERNIKGKSTPKDSKKSNEQLKKFELRLLGQKILAGTGRIVAFDPVGKKASDMGEILAFLSSNNLPAKDDLPLVFVNINKLYDIPVTALQNAGVHQLYTKWGFDNVENKSYPQLVNNEVNIDDHHVILLEREIAVKVITSFLEGSFEIEIRGLRDPKAITEKTNFFGYDKADKDYDKTIPPKQVDELTDVLIAVCKVDAKDISRGMNTFVQRDFSIYPPRADIVYMPRDVACTNDINAIRSEKDLKTIIPTSVIIEAQMTMDVNLGYVGCRIQNFDKCISRFYFIVFDSESAMAVIELITVINDYLLSEDRKIEALTGFAVDTGNLVLFYLEGPRDRDILKVWDLTADFHDNVKTCFSTSDKYFDRLYSEMLQTAAPFMILKMQAPMNSLLACPESYVNPALPEPCRDGLLKLARIIGGKLREPPCRQDMPTFRDLRCFHLELCPPSKPATFKNKDHCQWDTSGTRPETS